MPKRNELKEEKKVERFNVFMAAAERKINLEGKKTKLKKRRIELTAALEDTRVLTMRMNDLDDEAGTIARAVHVKMLKRLAVENE